MAGYGVSTACKPFFALSTRWLDAFVVRTADRIGKGIDVQRCNMMKILDEIPKNRLILKAFVDLANSKSELEHRAKHIRDMAIPISSSILRHEYKTLCVCCPTQDNNIWNYNSKNK